MHPPENVSELDLSLLAVAPDPRQVGRLYALLGEFCHQFRNRLHSLNICIYLLSRMQISSASPEWAGLVEGYRGLERLLQEVQSFCRPARLGLIRFGLGGLFDERRGAWSSLLEAGGGSLELLPPVDEAVGSFDPTLLALALDGLVAWRARQGGGLGGRTITLSWGLCDEHLFIAWEEHGEEPCADYSDLEERAASIALPVAARVVAEHGGRLELDGGDALKFKLCWPRDACAEDSSEPAPVAWSRSF